jgi:hypothetical protein
VRFAAILFVLLSLAGCKRSIETKEAVRQGVLDAVASRVNLSSMDVDVTTVNFKGDTAEATVDFRPKGAAPGSGIQMKYTLEDKGGKWVVKGRSDKSGGAPHGGAPHGTTTLPGMPGAGEMPPGHPTAPSGAPPGAETRK